LSDGTAVIEEVVVSIDGVRLERFVGNGANGFVFGGIEPLLNRRVAVKIWPPRRDRSRSVNAAEQAIREARKLTTINSEFVVPTVERQ
jgi:hypothetical protein